MATARAIPAALPKPASAWDWYAACAAVRPKSPSQKRRTFTVVREWVWDAAKVDIRVAAGLFIGAVLFSIPMIYGLLLVIGTAGHAGVTEIVGWLFLCLIVASGAGLVSFMVIGFPKLWIRRLVLAMDRPQIVEDFIHPRARLDLSPDYFFWEGGNLICVTNADGTAFSGRAKSPEISEEEVFDTSDTEDVAIEVRPAISRWEKVDTLLLFGIIAIGLFLVYAMWEQMQRAA